MLLRQVNIFQVTLLKLHMSEVSESVTCVDQMVLCVHDGRKS